MKKATGTFLSFASVLSVVVLVSAPACHASMENPSDAQTEADGSSPSHGDGDGGGLHSDGSRSNEDGASSDAEPGPEKPTTAAGSVGVPAKNGACPDDMVYVDTEFCPKVERDCLEVENDPQNHLKICHEYAKGKQKCLTKTEHRQFCIDPYEYPNKKGGHPAWNATWYEAQASCKSHGKRLCWGSEWTAACEGPEHTPFPYGWKRDHDTCNIDSFYITPEKKGGGFLFSSKDQEVRHSELSRLDQSVPSGSMEGCKSGFGVYDQTGNFDEWAISDEKPIEKSRWAALKGGAWGHVRNQCRPASHNHMPEEWYYFWSFRCCKDAEGAPSWHPPADAGNVTAPEVEAKDHFPEPIVAKAPPGPSKRKYDYREEKRRKALMGTRAENH